MLSRTLLLFIALTIFSCANDAASSYDKEGSYAVENESSMAMDYTEQSPSSPPPPTEKVDDAEEISKLILLRQAHCRLEVENMEHELNRIQFLVGEKLGYVSDLNIENNTWIKEATFLLRVPAKHFQSTLDSIKSFAKKVDYQRISTQDVTEEFVDISARLKTKKEVLVRYIDILRNKAKTVEEVLLAEEKIRRLQEEIESREGRLRYLKDRASMSTITVELYQTLEPQEEEDEESWVSQFLGDAGDSLGFGGRLVREITLGLMAIWPLLLIIGLLIWRRKAIRTRLFGRKE